MTAVLLAQAQSDRTVTGNVLGGAGNPAADAEVVLFAPPTAFDTRGPVEVRTKSDAAGKFSLKVSPLGRTVIGDVNYLARVNDFDHLLGLAGCPQAPSPGLRPPSPRGGEGKQKARTPLTTRTSLP